MLDKNQKELQPGQIVQWTSQAGGFEKTKFGRVLALIGENEQINKTLASIKGILEDHFIPQSRLKAQNVAGIKRVLVGVKRKTGLEDYYAPRPGQLRIIEKVEAASGIASSATIVFVVLRDEFEFNGVYPTKAAAEKRIEEIKKEGGGDDYFISEETLEE